MGDRNDGSHRSPTIPLSAVLLHQKHLLWILRYLWHNNRYLAFTVGNSTALNCPNYTQYPGTSVGMGCRCTVQQSIVACSICRCGSPSPVQKAGFMLVEVSFARNVKEKRNVIIMVSVSFCMSACPTKWVTILVAWKESVCKFQCLYFVLCASVCASGTGSVKLAWWQASRGVVILLIALHFQFQTRNHMSVIELLNVTSCYPCTRRNTKMPLPVPLASSWWGSTTSHSTAHHREYKFSSLGSPIPYSGSSRYYQLSSFGPVSVALTRAWHTLE